MRNPADYDLPRGTTWVCRDEGMRILSLNRSAFFAHLADISVRYFDARRLENESNKRGRRRFYDLDQILAMRRNAA